MNILQQIAKPLQILTTVAAGYVFLSFPCHSFTCDTGDKYCSCWEQRRSGENVCIKKTIMPTTKACMKWCDKEPMAESFRTIKDAWDDCELEEAI